MSGELLSISDFLGWLEERASRYAEWACEAMAAAAQHMGEGDSDRRISLCEEALVYLSIRRVYLQVETRVNQLTMVDDDLIERTVLLEMLSSSVNIYYDRTRWGIAHAVEYGKCGCYSDMLTEGQEAMCHENARCAYHCIYSYARYMPTAGTSMKGGD